MLVGHGLDDRFGILSATRRDAQPHQRTLEASIRWSHDLLPEDERVTFRRLAVFSGSFEPADAAEVDGHRVDLGPGAAEIGVDQRLPHQRGLDGRAGEIDRHPHAIAGRGGRTLKRKWADGPKSETPPGHWNVLANQVSDAPGLDHRLWGQGPVVDRLEWEHIQRVLGENDGNISATARALKMHRRTLQRKLAKRPVKE